MSSKQLKVLLADDNTDVREALAALIALEPMFVLVGAAGNATDAIELAAREQPDVALLDVRMPGGGGKAAAEGIRLCSPGSRLIALSGDGDQAAMQEMQQAGAVGYLVKGGSNEELVEAVKCAAEGHGSLSSAF